MTDLNPPVLGIARMRARQESTAAQPDLVTALITLRQVLNEYLGSTIAGIKPAEDAEKLATALEAAARVLRVQARTRQISEAMDTTR